MRQRLAVERPPKYTGVRNNFSWADHAARTLTTGSLIAWLAPDAILDPACGDASILEASYRLRPFQHAILSDASEAQIEAITPSFPHEKRALDLFSAFDTLATVVDCIVLTEILEHLEDPQAALRVARLRGNALVASSPIGDPESGRNHEHLWAWDVQSYGEELEEAGWNPKVVSTLQFPGEMGEFQIWVAR